METPLIELSLFLPIIEQGHPIITSNSRLSAKVLQAYMWYLSKNKGIPVVEKPKVYSLAEWLDSAWQDAQAQGDKRTAAVRLNTHQKLSIWESIITERLDAMPMARADHLSQMADKALKSMLLWQLTTDDLQTYISPFETQNNNQELSPFLGWANAFLSHIEKHQWITQEQQQARLLEIAQEKSQPSITELFLYGFDDIPPLTKALLKASCQTLNVLKNTSIQNKQHQVQRVECQHLDDEITQAARWCWQQLNTSCNQRIGIIVPQLGQIRERIERQFIATFEAHALLPEQARYTLPFNFSAGIPLGQCPLIAQALHLLRWVNGHSLPWHQVKSVLQAPFWQIANDESLAILWLKQLQDQEQTQWLWQDALNILYQLIKDEDAPCTLDKNALSTWLDHLSKNLAPLNIEKIKNNSLSSLPPEAIRASQVLKTPQAWITQFTQQLDQLGWPGARRLDSQEFQQMSEWQQGLTQLKSLNLVSSSWTSQEALRQISQLMSSTPFQALTPDSPIQILGALEGAGLRFDACWILGLDNQQWPSAAKPNPLLPVALQRDYKMPNATPERELEFADSLTKGYLQSAPKVVVSSAQFDGERELHPSPLIEHIPLHSLESVVTNNTCPAHLSTHYQQQWQTKQWDWIPTHITQPLPPQVQEQSGGASLLQWQSSNPMDAFARFRLQLLALPEASPHLANYVKGNITHKALEMLWRQWKTQAQLLALTAEQRTTMVSEAVSQALGRELVPAYRFGEHFRSLEHQRQVDLIEQWLQLEMERQPFKVQSVESQQRITLSRLSLRIRLDRTDVILNDDEKAIGSVLIDYKTGMCNRSDWLHERIKSPQLPLYAISYPTQVHGQSVAAIAFGQIKAGKTQLTGMSNQELSDSSNTSWNSSDAWDSHLNNWRQQLTELAKEWLSGDCHNNYYHSEAERYQQDYFAFNRWPEKNSLYNHWLEQHRLNSQN